MNKNTENDELQVELVWEIPELKEFKPVMRYNGQSGCAVPPYGGDDCPDFVQDDE